MFTLFLEALPNPAGSAIETIVWETPDGMFHRLTPTGRGGLQIVTRPDTGANVMALRRRAGEDATLYLSLEGSGTPLGVILFRSQDDYARKFYYACDQGDRNPLGVPCMVLRAWGLESTPFDLTADLIPGHPIGAPVRIPPVNLRVGVMRMRPDPRHARSLTQSP